MKSKLLLKNISAVSLVEAMDEKETYYVSVAGECPLNDQFDNLKEDFSFNQFVDAANHNKKIKKKYLKGSKDELLHFMYEELQDEYLCAMDFQGPVEMEEGDRFSGIKYGINSVIIDRKIPELVEGYLEKEEYKDKLSAFEKYFEDNEENMSLALLTSIIYLKNNKEDLEDIKEQLEVKLLDAYGEHIYEKLLEESDINMRIFIESKREKEEIAKELKGIKEKYKALKDENNKLLKLRSQFSDILQSINKSIKEGSEVYPKALKEVNSFKKDVSEGNYNSIITNLTLQVSDLKIVNKEIKDKVKDLEGKLAMANEKNHELYLELGRYKEDSKKLLEETALVEQASTALEVQSSQETKIPEEKPKKKAMGNKGKSALICYCEIIDGIHYAVHPEGDRYEILNIRSKAYEKTYLSPGQFIKIDTNGNLRHVFDQYTDKNLVGLNLVEVRYFNGEYYYRIDDEEVQLNLRKGFYPEDDMIFAVDKEGTIRSLFSHVRTELNYYEESIKAKGHKIYYILKKSGKGIAVRAVFSGEESFLPGSYGECEPGGLMFFDNRGHLLQVTASSKLYTTSIYYTFGKEAEVIEQGGKKFFKLKATGDKVKVGKCTKPLNTGGIVILDEFYNILKYPEEVKAPREYKDEIKAALSEVEYSEETIELTHKVLILGDPAFSSNYKLSFYKKGYEVEVVNGFDSFSKISLKFKDKDHIIVMINHVSHDNMWRIKEGGYSAMYTSADGANRALEEFEKYIKDNSKEQ